MRTALRIMTLALVVLVLTGAGKRRTTIFVIGDSTAAEKSKPAQNPERGWGMVLQGFFDDDIRVDNRAVNGRSSKSFIDEGRWQKVLDDLQPGDYVFIQFGHNDEKPKPDRHTDPGSTFDDNLRRYVNETRAKGGIPVLFNCVVRRNFLDTTRLQKPVSVAGADDDEKLRSTSYDGEELVNSDTLIDTHGAYRLAPMHVARELDVPFVDANQITHDIEQGMGVVGSRRLHMWFKPGENAFVGKGRKDNTHYNVYGARVVAGALADEVGRQVPALRKHIHHYDYVVSQEGRGNFLTLQAAVDAVPEGAGKVSILVLDGTWKRPVVAKGKKVRLVKYPGVTVE